MYRGMKYITFYGPMHNEIVIFMNTWDHGVFADRLGIKKDDIIGAGFISCDRDNPEPRCVGKSISLDISAQEGDTKIFHNSLNW